MAPAAIVKEPEDVGATTAPSSKVSKVEALLATLELEETATEELLAAEELEATEEELFTLEEETEVEEEVTEEELTVVELEEALEEELTTVALDSAAEETEAELAGVVELVTAEDWATKEVPEE